MVRRDRGTPRPVERRSSSAACTGHQVSTSSSFPHERRCQPFGPAGQPRCGRFVPRADYAGGESIGTALRRRAPTSTPAIRPGL
jgi:hypothetical protein